MTSLQSLQRMHLVEVQGALGDAVLTAAAVDGALVATVQQLENVVLALPVRTRISDCKLAQRPAVTADSEAV